MCCSSLKVKKNEIMFILFLIIPMAKGAVPGTFFWKPRLGLDLSIPTTEYTAKVWERSRENIQKGLVVLVEGYQAGVTIVSLASGVSNARTYPYFNPMSAYFYTHVYRWMLRYISLIPFWMGGSGLNFCDTHKVWKRRFYYMDEFVPSWIRKALFYVDKEEWAKEELEYKRYKKYAEPAFGKHYRFPNKYFQDFKSQYTIETMNVEEDSSNSV